MQLQLEGFEGCACWREKDPSGMVLAGYSCPDCVKRALDFLEDMLYLDREVSVSALSRSGGVV